MHQSDPPGAQAASGKALSRANALRASVAQQLLLARLKARNRRDLAVDMMERGAHVLWVTCKAWFASGELPSASEGDNLDEKTDAHRDH